MLKVNIVGIGPGNPDLLTGAARKAIEKSNILIGDKRMLAAFATADKKVYDTIKTAEIASIAAAADPASDEVAVLVSGDVPAAEAIPVKKMWASLALPKPSAASCPTASACVMQASAAWCILPAP